MIDHERDRRIDAAFAATRTRRWQRRRSGPTDVGDLEAGDRFTDREGGPVYTVGDVGLHLSSDGELVLDAVVYLADGSELAYDGRCTVEVIDPADDDENTWAHGPPSPSDCDLCNADGMIEAETGGEYRCEHPGYAPLALTVEAGASARREEWQAP
ncbi:MAG: hypothetical protein GY795_24555 [Desulfobacterales bacterium]|nr:hypothetical protein [Desulfobacterales bacterium]